MQQEPKQEQEIYQVADKLNVVDYTCNFPIEEIIKEMELRGIRMTKKQFSYCG